MTTLTQVGPKPKLKEKDFQRAVTDMAGYLGWRHYHEGHSFGSSPGKPDLELSHQEYGIAFLELKTGTYKPTAKQIEWIDWYRSCGLPAYVVYPEDFDAIEAILNGNRVEIEEWWR